MYKGATAAIALKEVFSFLNATFADFMRWQLNLASKLVSLHFTVKSCFNNELAAPRSGTCFLTHC